MSAGGRKGGWLLLRGLFVTGTSTGVGKTVVCAALLHRFRLGSGGTPERIGPCPVRYWKPIQTGIEQDDDTAEVRRLSGCEPAGVLAEGIRLARPLSPHLSARLARTSIDVGSLMAMVARESADQRWIVEGAGGVLVPLNEGELMIDLMARLALPVLIVSRSGLGTINHTLLTLEALRRRALSVVGVVMHGDLNPENRLAIEQYGHVPVVGELPTFVPLTPDAVQAWAVDGLRPSASMQEAFA